MTQEDSGWITLHRKILKWEWYDDTNAFRVFLHLLLSANHAPKSWHGTTIKRGQIITGRKKLAKELGMTEQSVRTSLTRLKSTNEITIKSTSQCSLITLNQYDHYQLGNQAINQQLTNEQPATNHKQEYKQLKKERITPPKSPKGDWGGFAQFWELYPKKKGKAAALKSWNKKRPDLGAVTEAIAWQKKTEQWGKQDGQFIPFPATWLNQERWEDEQENKRSVFDGPVAGEDYIPVKFR